MPTFVQKNTTSDFTGTTHTTLTLAITAGASGNLQCGFVTAAGVNNTATVKDNNNVSYTMAEGTGGVNDNTNGNQSWTFYQPNISGAPTSISVTFNTALGFCAIQMQEWSGIAVSSPLDVHTITNAASTTGPASAIVTTTVNGELIYGATVPDSGSASSISQGSGYTIRNNVAGGAFADESQVQTNAGGIAATFSYSVAQASQIGIMTFKAAAAAGQTPYQPYFQQMLAS